MKHSWLLLLSFSLSVACTPASPSGESNSGTGGSTGGGTGGAGTPTGGSGGTGGGTGGSPAPTGTGGTTPSGTGGGGTATGGTTGATGGSTGTTDAGSTSETPPASGGIGGELHQALLEAKCGAPKAGKFCKPEIKEKNVTVKFGGEAGKMYDVVLKVWGVVEGMNYSGGMSPGGTFYIGGMGITATYGVYGMEIGGTKYHVNYFTGGNAGNDKVNLIGLTTPVIKIPGASDIVLFGRDMNTNLTWNHTMLVVPDAPAGLTAKLKQPVDGNFFYVEVVSAKEAN